MDYIKTCGLKEPLIFREYPEALGMVYVEMIPAFNVGNLAIRK